MTHTIVAIGWIGIKRCYLDVPREEAIRRYMQSEDEDPTDDMIKEFEVGEDGEFNAYDIWRNQPLGER